MRTAAAAALGLAAAAALHLAAQPLPPLAELRALLSGGPVESWEQAVFLYSALPRTVMAILVGAALGLAGSLLQQLLRNRLASPLTLGVASGAWLGMILGAVLVPAFAARNELLFSLGGACAAAALVGAIAGRRGLGGLPAVLAGMATNLLFGAIAHALLLANDQAVRNLFVWGAGDLGQTGWDWALWLAPQLALAAAAALALGRPLTLMRLGAEGAGGRGLDLRFFAPVAVVTALWLTASAVTAVGLIGFVGLIAPNLARLLGARAARGELLAAAALGAATLLLTDAAALTASLWTRDLVPSGPAAALVGAPALLWLGLRRGRVEELAAYPAPRAEPQPVARKAALLAVLFSALLLGAIFLGPTAEGWRLADPAGFAVSLRWPRVLAAAAAGAALAVAGAILQRLLRNPLASPEVVGVTAGAALALVGASVFLGASIRAAGAPAALAGAALALGALLLILRRSRGDAGAVALAGVSLAALLDALLQFALATGGEEVYLIVGWLAGSTFRVEPHAVLLLVAGALPLALAALALGRPLALLGVGDAFAAGRGLAVVSAKTLLLALAGALAALATATVGLVAFVGLVAPHIARMLGARRPPDHLALSALIGALILAASDWVGRTAFHPIQIPAGVAAASLGGAYFLMMLARRRTLL